MKYEPWSLNKFFCFFSLCSTAGTSRSNASFYTKEMRRNIGTNQNFLKLIMINNCFFCCIVDMNYTSDHVLGIFHYFIQLLQVQNILRTFATKPTWQLTSLSGFIYSRGNLKLSIFTSLYSFVPVNYKIEYIIGQMDCLSQSEITRSLFLKVRNKIKIQDDPFSPNQRPKTEPVSGNLLGRNHSNRLVKWVSRHWIC